VCFQLSSTATYSTRRGFPCNDPGSSPLVICAVSRARRYLGGPTRCAGLRDLSCPDRRSSLRACGGRHRYRPAQPGARPGPGLVGASSAVCGRWRRARRGARGSAETPGVDHDGHRGIAERGRGTGPRTGERDRPGADRSAGGAPAGTRPSSSRCPNRCVRTPGCD
jgi:hypothetical protein